MLLSVVEAICGLLLVGIILLQKSRSHGAAAGLAFGAGMGESLFGAQATNILQKITVVLATIFLVNTTLLAVLGSRRHRAGGGSVTDNLPSAPPIEQQQQALGPGPMGPMGTPLAPGGMPSVPMQALPDAPAPQAGAAPEPAQVEVATPAPAPEPAPANDAGEKPAPQ